MESEAEVFSFRDKILRGIYDAFQPDAIFTDYLPIGKNEEFASYIQECLGKKYFIARGIMDHAGSVRQDILGGRGEEFLEKYFDRILVAFDKKICDVVNEYNLSPLIAQKVSYVGYVSQNIYDRDKVRTRRERGLSEKDIWVVCSAGGGKLGEGLIKECEDLAYKHKNIYFDIICGPRSRLAQNFIYQHIDNGRVIIHKENKKLKSLHAASNINICTGSYNSIVESLQGDASILCWPVQLETNDEQYIHANRLFKYVDITTVHNALELEKAFEFSINKIRNNTYDKRKSLDCEGVSKVREIVFNDLQIRLTPEIPDMKEVA